MKIIIALFIPLLLGIATYAQKVYQIRADSVRIYNVCDTAELILENKTQGVNGYLYNKGSGRTEFSKIQLRKIGTSQIAIVGQDTLDLNTLPGIGGIDTAYREGDYIKYQKKSNLYTIYAPLPDFRVVPDGQNNPFTDYKDNAMTGFSAYNSPDMPTVSDQAQVNPGTGKLFYTGHAVRYGATGYQMAVNWDGETFGPKGAFLRIKDDTNLAGWGAWRELLFKDYGDKKYAKTDSTYTKLNLSTPGQAQVSWNNLINVPTLSVVEQDNLTTVLTRGNVSKLKMYVHAGTDMAAPTISLGIGGNNSGINAESGLGILTLRSYGKEIARWRYDSFTVSTVLKVNGDVYAPKFNTAVSLETSMVPSRVYAGTEDGFIRPMDQYSIKKFLGIPRDGETLASVCNRNNLTNRILIAQGLQLDSTNENISITKSNDLILAINSPYGTVNIGCNTQANASFTTTANGYYFDKDLYVPTAIRVGDYGYNTVLDGKNLSLASGDGNGIRFLNGSDESKIFVSSSATSGYPMLGPFSSDVNMYFRMNRDNRGFVFVTGDNNPAVQIDAQGMYVAQALRLMGTGGLIFQKYGGGFEMPDNSWVRVYGGKNFTTATGILRTESELQVGVNGTKLKVPATGIPTIDGKTIFHAGNLQYSSDVYPNYLAQRDASGSLFASGFYQSSKASLKKNIADFNEAALPLLNKVQIKQFVYKDDKDENLHFGIIADNTDWHFSTRNQDKFDTNSSLAITMKAVQELSEENTVLKKQVAALQQNEEVEQLKNEVSELLKRVESVEKMIKKD
ncbi:MAG: tail fiber domain-containing protein [Chitinophaga sp.]|uniref:tail fiber domain-containing protein n=1 Tax=Chitinophaga sp. TaxID=1869181 RepID=UPI0025C4A422|nr:tail fiber domain-containing protein [Chitinophaga sp.]MBV8255095.1 tail fiber domain-containing protein [Chitinophaga sp.]